MIFHDGQSWLIWLNHGLFDIWRFIDNTSRWAWKISVQLVAMARYGPLGVSGRIWTQLAVVWWAWGFLVDSSLPPWCHGAMLQLPSAALQEFTKLHHGVWHDDPHHHNQTAQFSNHDGRLIILVAFHHHHRSILVDQEVQHIIILIAIVTKSRCSFHCRASVWIIGCFLD